jgi:hypothetical protein
MKQADRVSCFKAVAAGLLLLLVHTNAAAQEDTTIVSYPDTVVSAEDYPQVVYDPDELYTRVLPSHDTTLAAYRAVPSHIVDRLQKDKDFEYANDPAYWQKEKPKEIKGSWLNWVLNLKWLQYLLVGLVIAAVVFALYKILVSNRLLLFRRTSRGGMPGDEHMAQGEDLPSMINEAEQQRAFRLAVRYRYMKTLKGLDERGLIQLNAQSTNWDYVNQLSTHPLKKTFQLLTRAYEYVWYGEFEPSEEQYGFLKTEFLQFENALRA